MTRNSLNTEIRTEAEWLLTPEELESLHSTRRLFLLGLSVAAILALAVVGLTAWMASREPREFAPLAAPILASGVLVSAAAWCAGRARIIGRDLRSGRAQMRWGRVTRVWARLRVVEVEGILFPLQVTPVPVLRHGERVWLRFAPGSRITLGVRTLRQVVAEERLTGRSPCPGVLAELGDEPWVNPPRPAA